MYEPESGEKLAVRCANQVLKLSAVFAEPVALCKISALWKNTASCRENDLGS